MRREYRTQNTGDRRQEAIAYSGSRIARIEHRGSRIENPEYRNDSVGFIALPVVAFGGEML